jgi:chromosomal replication initiator protein
MNRVNYYALPGMKTYRNIKVQVIDKENIIRVVCEHFDYTVDQLKEQDRHRPFVFARNCLTYFLFKYTRMSKVEIGKLLGKHHTSIIHSLRALQDLADTEESVNETISDIRRKLLF